MRKSSPPRSPRIEAGKYRQECGFKTKTTDEPCHNPVGWGTRECAAGHPVDLRLLPAWGTTVRWERTGEVPSFEDIVGSTTLFDRHLADGWRTEVALLPVDTATMAMGVQWASGTTTEIFDRLRGEGVEGMVSCSTFAADGRYPVVLLERDEGITGLEVIFNIPAVDVETDLRCEADGLTPPDVATSRNSRSTPEARERVNDYFAKYSARYSATWDEMQEGNHPADDCEPKVLKELEVTGRVFLGDPCYGSPSKEIEMPPGRYVAVVWRHGDDTCRLGLYRRGEG